MLTEESNAKKLEHTRACFRLQESHALETFFVFSVILEEAGVALAKSEG